MKTFIVVVLPVLFSFSAFAAQPSCYISKLIDGTGYAGVEVNLAKSTETSIALKPVDKEGNFSAQALVEMPDGAKALIELHGYANGYIDMRVPGMIEYTIGASALKTDNKGAEQKVYLGSTTAAVTSLNHNLIELKVPVGRDGQSLQIQCAHYARETSAK